MMSPSLNPDKALIFRIVHIKNIPWLLANGIYSQNSENQDPNYIQIGNPQLIMKRKYRPVDTSPGGVLGDYIPFYFTPYSMMMYNIITGHNVAKQKRDDLVILVSSMHKLAEKHTTFLFTDQHGYLSDTLYYSDLTRLKDIDWKILQKRDFKYDSNDPGKQARYQAEALVHEFLDLDNLLGFACYNEISEKYLNDELKKVGLNMAVKKTPGWYFQ